jgi:hypothetical protein
MVQLTEDACTVGPDEASQPVTRLSVERGERPGDGVVDPSTRGQACG